MSDLTPETLAELRRLLDEAKRRLSSPRRAGKTYAMEALRNAAVNALPALLDAAAERDRLAEAVERVRALHIAHDCTSHAGIATICAHRPGICLACLKPLPCPTIRALGDEQS